MNEEEIGFPCPICGMDLSDMDEMWRLVHVNSCLAQNQIPMKQKASEANCPICNADISHLTAELATRHVNDCMDRVQKHVSENRQTERCPICGQCIKNLNERQRRLHSQTCRKSENAKEAEIVYYPKVVESLPTPAEWEILEQQNYNNISRQINREDENMRIPIFGKITETSSLQGIDGFSFINAPLFLSTPI